MKKLRIQLKDVGNLLWPRQCACCGDVPDTYREVSTAYASTRREYKLTLKVPYCSVCKEHVDKALSARGGLWDLLYVVGFWLAIVPFVIVVLNLGGRGVSPGLTVTAGTVAAGLVFAGFILLRRRIRRAQLLELESLMKPECTTLEPSVSATMDYQFLYIEFENPDFAEAFRSANAIVGTWWMKG